MGSGLTTHEQDDRPEKDLPLREVLSLVAVPLLAAFWTGYLVGIWLAESVPADDVWWLIIPSFVATVAAVKVLWLRIELVRLDAWSKGFGAAMLRSTSQVTRPNLVSTPPRWWKRG